MSNDDDIYRSRYPDARQWTVSRFHRDRRSVLLRPQSTTSVPRWVADIRRILPSLQQRSPAELLEEVRHSGALDFGIVAGREAQHISELLRHSATVVEVAEASFVSHFPSVDGGGLIIENDSEAEAFCLRLIAEGATVVDIQD